MTAGFDEYDFSYEKRYFALKIADTLTVHGRAWPDVTAHQRREEDAWPR